MKARLSLRARLSLLFAASMGAVLLISGLLVGHAVQVEFKRHDSEELKGKIGVIREILAAATSYESITALPLQFHNTVMAGHPYSSVVIVRGDGKVLLSMGQPKVVDHLLQGAEFGDAELVTWSKDGRTYRIAAGRVEIGALTSEPAEVAISFDITRDQTFLATFTRLLWATISVATLLMGFIGWYAVHRGLAPLRSVSATLSDISTRALDKSMPIAELPGDLQGLVSAFNRMLARLNDSFKRLSEFSSDIAHELRTPINNMMLQTQVALGRKRSADEYCANLQSNVEELRRLSRMIEDMLFLANADNHLLVPRKEAVDLGAEVAKLVDFFDIAASERRVTLVQSGEAPTIVADRMMIQRALSNLLSNALRFTPEGKSIEVDVRKTADVISISVSNPGPEIPAEHLPKIFDRLYRVDASRREGQTVNVGLGLAITKSIMEMHGGTVTAESQIGHTCFTVTFPPDLSNVEREEKDIETHRMSPTSPANLGLATP